MMYPNREYPGMNITEQQGSRARVLEYPGISQFTGGGTVSACGLAAMNCARIVLNKAKDLKKGRATSSIHSRATVEVIDFFLIYLLKN